MRGGMEVDKLFRYAIDEVIIERKGDGSYDIKGYMA